MTRDEIEAADAADGDLHAVVQHLIREFRAGPTLRDHLAGQLELATRDPRERLIGGFLIDAVDEAGYKAVRSS